MSLIGHRSCEINMKEKHPCHTKLCAFIWLISGPQILNLRFRNQILGKLLLSRKLPYFRGSSLLQCLILSTSSITQYHGRFDAANNYFEYLPIVSTAFNKRVFLWILEELFFLQSPIFKHCPKSTNSLSMMRSINCSVI